jgi:hypothetical protein
MEPMASGATQPRPMSCYKLYILLLMHNTMNDGAEVLCLWAKYQYSYIHCIGNASFQ